MNRLLHSKHIDDQGAEHNYFQKLTPAETDLAQWEDLEKLKEEVKRALQKGWITSDIADWLIPDEFSPGRLYGLVKDHVDPEKWPEGGIIPPLRPVESASGTFENASHFVYYHSNDLVKGLPSHWEDTPDMLRFFESENVNEPQSAGTIPVTLDVVGLYTTIPLVEVFKYF